MKKPLGYRHLNSLTLLNSSLTSTKPIPTNLDHCLPPSSAYPELHTFRLAVWAPVPFNKFFLKFQFFFYTSIISLFLPIPGYPPPPSPPPELHTPPLLPALPPAHLPTHLPACHLGPRHDRTCITSPASGAAAPTPWQCGSPTSAA